MTEDRPSECITLKELDEIIVSDPYYSESETLQHIFQMATQPLSVEVQQDIIESFAKSGEALPSLESLTPTDTTASGIVNHLINAGLPYTDNNKNMAFDREAIRVFFLAHDIALPWQLFPSSPSNSKQRLAQLLGLRKIQASLLEKANARQRNNDEQEERELRRLQLEEARARAETRKVGNISITSDGYINVYEDSDLRHNFLIRVGVLEKLSAELGSGFEKGDELENAQQQLLAIIDTINKKPSVYRDDVLKEEIKRYLDCWLSADNTSPEYAILQHRLSQWRAKYLSEKSMATVDVPGAPTVAAHVDDPINNPPAGSTKKRKYRKGEVKQKEAAAMCGVSPKLISNWVAGKNAPEDFPGLFDSIVLRQWAETYKTKNRQKRIAIGMNNATPVDPKIIEACHSSSAFSDTLDESDNRELEELLEEQRKEMAQDRKRIGKQR